MNNVRRNKDPEQDLNVSHEKYIKPFTTVNTENIYLDNAMSKIQLPPEEKKEEPKAEEPKAEEKKEEMEVEGEEKKEEPKPEAKPEEKKEEKKEEPKPKFQRRCSARARSTG